MRWLLEVLRPEKGLLMSYTRGYRLHDCQHGTGPVTHHITLFLNHPAAPFFPFPLFSDFFSTIILHSYVLLISQLCSDLLFAWVPAWQFNTQVSLEEGIISIN